MTHQWIGIVGRNGSGKSSVCEYLGDNGFHVVSLSDVVRHHASKQALGQDRDALTQLANQLKDQHGTDYFARESYQSVQSKPMVVFDSIRHPDEVAFLKQQRVLMIGIDAELRACYDRIKARGKGTDFVTFEEFKRHDEYEMSGQSYGQSILACLAICDFRLTNNQELPHLFDQVEKIINTVFKDSHVK
jgi:dephospho-CoA kinase